MRNHSFFLIPLFLILALLGAACSSDVGLSTEATSSDTTTGGDSDSDTTGGDSDTTGGDSDSTGDISDSDEFCQIAIERETAQDGFADVNLFEPTELEDAMRQNANILQSAIDAAPDQIRGDLLVIQTDLDSTIEAMDAVGWVVTEMADSDMESSVEADAAGDRVDDFIRSACGIDPDANEDGAPSDQELAEQLAESDQGDEFIVEALEQAGFSSEEANCIAQQVGLDSFLEASGDAVPDDLLQALSDCNIDLSRLGELGGDPDIGDSIDDLGEVLGDEGLTGPALQIFVDEMVKQGFTQAEAECLANEMFAGGAIDQDILGAFSTCGISLDRLEELGG